MTDHLFPRRRSLNPRIYAYRDSNPDLSGFLKVGYTERDAAARVAEQYPTLRPGPPPWRIELNEPAMRADGSVFTDRNVHRQLEQMGIRRAAGEWFQCDVGKVRAAYLAVLNNASNVESRTQHFDMRPEQRTAVNRTVTYFRERLAEDPDRTPHFLWNAKMRFGKTFATYQLAREMGWSRVLVLTFKPAVENAWRDDLASHIDFEGWQFVSRDGLNIEDCDLERPIVCFGSFQDYLGRNVSTGGIKTKNEWVHQTEWDCVVLDEYHYGAWRESARDLFEQEDKREVAFAEGEGINVFDEAAMPIRTKAYLYLSGTPFRAIASGEFIEEQIFNWTYSDEQRAKEIWEGGNNPYAALPKMVLMTYRMPDDIREVALQGEYDEFDLNEFFRADGEWGAARFIHEDEVQKWLSLIRGAFSPGNVDELKLGSARPPMPFSDLRLLSNLTHTFWFLPSVAACHAMENLLRQRQNGFYHDYKVIVAAGASAGIGVKALEPVERAMGDPMESKSITLSCGKLTTGVTVKPWSGIFMLRSCKTPETYFQAAFRVQSPWTVPGAADLTREIVVKDVCYVFDFAPDRALRQIADYSCRLDIQETSPEQKVAEFISFLPVLAYDGSSMKEINAGEVLDIAMSGTSATLLARRWESALLVNVDNSTLKRLMDNQDAMTAIMQIEGFRSLNLSDAIETIINKSDAVSEARRRANDEDVTPKEKKELTDQEKEIKNVRKQIQDKLIKFATRIPIFMYLTDYREETLKDVIRDLEPQLFKRVTNLTSKDFDLLLGLGVFNQALMNDAVYKFRRYENASLEYTGINRHKDHGVGLFDTVISRDDFDQRIIAEESEPYEFSMPTST